jgi:aminocarboxymuconate-semialdehyde decarboxylase
VFNEYYLWNAVGNPVETAVTAAHMVLSGVMQKYPKLKVLLAHGGGAILSLRGRLRHAVSFQPQARARLTESVDDSLRRFYYDTVTHDVELLQGLVEYVGPEHVLLGSDYPFDMGVEYPTQIVEELNLNAEDKSLILGGNAERLFKKEN